MKWCEIFTAGTHTDSKGNKKTFAYIYERNGLVQVNVKCDPEWIQFWRDAYPGVLPGYHMNKDNWITILLDGTVSEAKVLDFLDMSYDLIDHK